RLRPQPPGMLGEGFQPASHPLRQGACLDDLSDEGEVVGLVPANARLGNGQQRTQAVTNARLSLFVTVEGAVQVGGQDAGAATLPDGRPEILQKVGPGWQGQSRGYQPASEVAEQGA